MKKKSIIPLLSALLFISCGSDSSDKKTSSESSTNNGPSQEEQIVYPADGTNIEGNYIARFTTLNSHVNGTVPGSVIFSRNQDRVYVYLRLFAGYPKAWHQQKIYEGTRCPTLADDSNGDGFIDITEAEAVLGKVLIPLDTDISSQKSGRNFYPLGDLSGSYYYERTTSFSRMFRDLKDIKNQTEEYKKLEPHEGFSIEGKAVMVQGVIESVAIPETVQSTARYKPFQTLPIVCGIFKADNREPGDVDNGEIPGPIADVEPGQDRPAPQGEGEREGNNQTSDRADNNNEASNGDSPTVDADGRSPDRPAPRPPTNYGEDNNDSSDDNGRSSPSTPTTPQEREEDTAPTGEVREESPTPPSDNAEEN